MPLLTPPPAAPQRGDRTTFASRVDAFITWLINFVTELVALVSNLNSIAAGGAYAIPCVAWGDFSTTAAGNGRLAIVGADQTQATNIYVNTIDSRGKNVQQMLSDVFSSTSGAKACLTISAQGDPSKWISYRVTAWSYGGFATAGKLDVVCVGYSGANPIPVGTSVNVQITRTGDKGDKGDKGADANLLMPILYVREEFAQGSNPTGYGTTSPQARRFNTVRANSITGASLSANQIALPAGTYDFEGAAPTATGTNHRLALYNVTDGAFTEIGRAGYEFSPGGGTVVNDYASIRGRLVIPAQKTFELRHYVSNSSSATSWGTYSNLVGNEIYAELTFWKLA